MRIAVVGTGISGLVAAHLLAPHHEISVFEADARLGGHANTVRVTLDDGAFDVDTGFIVYNERNYPLFTALLDRLGVATQPSTMSLSITDEASGRSWCGTSPATVFAERSNLVRPSFLALLGEIPRFNRAARALLKDPTADEAEPLSSFLARHRISRRLSEQYLVPMGAAIWSADPSTFADYPAVALFRFLDNHGLISFGERPAWRTVTGGSIRYVAALSAPFADRVRLATPISWVKRTGAGVEVCTAAGSVETFDRVVLACHSDTALALHGDADSEERAVLGALRYQRNTAVLHTDRRFLPRREAAWAAWNVSVPARTNGAVVLTYHMNRLQNLASRHQICVTLNRDDAIDPALVLATSTFEHPVFDAAALAAQRCRDTIQGRGGVYYAGAYWGYGFHEDGVRSAYDVAGALGVPTP